MLIPLVILARWTSSLFIRADGPSVHALFVLMTDA
jgi:hypothetical protein